jgi:hypothetical protein
MKEQMCENGASSVADFRFERKAMAMNTEEVRSGECVLMFVVRMENLRMKMNTIDGERSVLPRSVFAPLNLLGTRLNLKVVILTNSGGTLCNLVNGLLVAQGF